MEKPVISHFENIEGYRNNKANTAITIEHFCYLSIRNDKCCPLLGVKSFYTFFERDSFTFCF